MSEMKPIPVREAARRRMSLSGPDAQALEGALAMTERERDEVRADLERVMKEHAADLNRLDDWRLKAGEARANHMEIARHMGMVYEADGHADQPASAKEIVAALKLYDEQHGRLRAEVELLKDASAGLDAERKELTAKMDRLTRERDEARAELDAVEVALQRAHVHRVHPGRTALVQRLQAAQGHSAADLVTILGNDRDRAARETDKARAEVERVTGLMDAFRADRDNCLTVIADLTTRARDAESDSARLRGAVEAIRGMECFARSFSGLTIGEMESVRDILTAALSPATAEGPRAQLAAANDMTLRSEIDAIHDVLTDAGVPLREPDGGRRMLARDRISLLVSERERAAHIAETHPLHPSTQTGERQRWLRESIAAAIRATATPAPVEGEKCACQWEVGDRPCPVHPCECHPRSPSPWDPRASTKASQP